MLTPRLPDAEDRARAATTFDQNVVVTAGAGTGKTTLLVDRLVHLLMREPGRLLITEIVALTFTNKAADEMRVRLRERLQAYLAARLDQAPQSEAERGVAGEVQALMQRYHLGKEEVDRRSSEALRQLDRSAIGTIHSFASTLLRLYPVEAGLDPRFQEDDGGRFEPHFEEAWDRRLQAELSAQGPRTERWKQALKACSLEEIRQLAFSLCAETVPLERLAGHAASPDIPVPVRVWLEGLVRQAAALLARHPEDRLIEQHTRAAHRILQAFLARENLRANGLQEDAVLLASGRSPAAAKGWEAGEVEEAKTLARVARGLLETDKEVTGLLCDLLIPFVRACRDGFHKAGHLSFDGLLVRARDLLRDHRAVRAAVKRKFKAILIDEFQDTDPLQYEILLFLAEAEGRHAPDWRSAQVAPGKVFVVGDPKQSIYAFRRADIEAYHRVVEEVLLPQQGVACHLTTNFRSHAGILDLVNGVFATLMQHREAYQPAYIPIHPAVVGESTSSGNPDPLPFRRVELRLVRPAEEDRNAEGARRREAEAIARWLKEEVLGKARIVDKNRERVPVEPRDVAILLRKLTQAHYLLEALRRQGIRYVVEGEKHFFATQEVIDAVNLLRAVENPLDTAALVGLLRSPVGGLSDAEIYALRKQGLLDYRVAEREDARLEPAIRALYETLARLHRETRCLPVGEAVARILEEVPIAILAAQSYQGEQAVANLEKLRRVAEKMEREGWSTLREVLARLERSIAEVREEGESPLAEETVNAVKVLSIHKAKGLEFPVVVLAGCDAGIDSGRWDSVEVRPDWSTGLVGLKIGGARNAAGVLLEEKDRLRRLEEEKRVLYVAMTRAREHLLISCVSTNRRSNGSFLALLEEAMGDLAGLQEQAMLTVGEGRLHVQVIEPSETPRSAPQTQQDVIQINWAAYAERWRERIRRHEEAIRQPHFLSPTLLKQREREWAEGAPPQGLRKEMAGEAALVVGELAHRFLQAWDFAADPATFREPLRAFLARHPNGEPLRQEMEMLFEQFFRSKVYEEIRHARILGREVPLLMPWGDQIMEGVLDLIYEREGQLYVADYKTDRIEPSDLPQALARYRLQAQVYTEAVRRSLRQEVVGFKLVFLRLGEAVPVEGVEV